MYLLIYLFIYYFLSVFKQNSVWWYGHSTLDVDMHMEVVRHFSN